MDFLLESQTFVPIHGGPGKTERAPTNLIRTRWLHILFDPARAPVPRSATHVLFIRRTA
ncbi:hypothetical protein ACFY4C_16035 [Actinomadura viridis]|uniref:hypothetical protein n=1 Tax=Actinomadura viridis TaxID=58110 RepID=UPI00367A3651